MKKRYKVGEAPWEQSAEKKRFKVGQAPWEIEDPTPEVMPEGDGIDQLSQQAVLDSLKQQDPEQHGGKQLLDYGIRALDYTGGIGRMAASGYADMYNMATGKPTVSRTEDLSNMLQGQAPSTEEYLDRSGMEDGIARKALGFAGDIALDPMTYATFGASALTKGSKAAQLAKRVANPISNVTEAAGNKMIRSGVSQIDEALEMSGKKRLSDLMIENNIVGTNKTIRKKVDKLSDKFAEQRKVMYKQVDETGAKVNTDDLLDDLSEYTSNFRTKTGNELSDDIANKIEDQLFKALPKDKTGKYITDMSVQQASNVKTQLRKSLPDSFFDNFGRVKDEYKEGVDKISGIFQKNIENTANRAVPGLGDDIAMKNKDWGVLLDADSPLGREARKAAGKNFITSIDAMIGGAAMRSGNVENLKILAAKKAADVAKTTVFRTRGGRALKNLGREADVIGRRSLINMNRKEDQ